MCDAPEPSTPIADICSPILIERVLAKSEENNEWRWTVQGLDDIAKTLLLSLDIELLSKTDYPTLHTEKKNILVPNSNIITGDQDGGKLQQELQDIIITNATTAISPLPAQTIIAETVDVATGVQDEQSNSEVNIAQLFFQAIETGQWSEVVSALHILDNSMLLQVIDGGGQPTFQEIFPLLISGPSVRLLIFKLTDDLQKSYSVHYQPKHGLEQTWLDSEYVVKDFISHAISNQLYLTTKRQYDSKLLLVGTHKDKLEGSEEEKIVQIERITTLLHDLIHESKWIKVQRFTGIDNFETKDIMKIKKSIEELISQTLPLGTPAPWMVFDFVLHKYAKIKKLHKVEKAKCYEICGVKDDETDVVIHFFHYEAGTLLYYSDIPDLNNWVITDFQPIVDSISKVIAQYFCNHGEQGNKYSRGLLKIETLRQTDSCLEPGQLLSLMKHRQLICMTKDGMIFMPSLLPSIELAYCNNSCSFLIMFEQFCCPTGLFCAVSTRLVNAHNWDINMAVLQFKNKMCFQYLDSGVSYSVLFIAYNSYYEVCFNEKSTPQIRFDIFKAINESFTKVCKDLQHILPSYGFYCTCGATISHQREHIARVECDYKKMKCCLSSILLELTGYQRTWFHQVQPQSIPIL